MTYPLGDPKPGGVLRYVAPGTARPLQVSWGWLRESLSGDQYPVVRGIPRFVGKDNYDRNGGYQRDAFRTEKACDRWELETRRQRLFAGTEWSAGELQGKSVLEIGCGSGAFTRVFLDCGADVWSVDSSAAVEACWVNLGPHEHLHVAQADVHHLPFPRGSFDFVFMFGVMPHTSDPRRLLSIAVEMAKPGGKVAVDTCATMPPCRWTSKYHWRWLTRHLPPRLLMRIVAWYVPRWLLVDNALAWRMPRLHEFLVSVIPCWNYAGIIPGTREQLTEWAILDTYCALSAYHDQPCSRLRFVQWLNDIPGIEFSVKREGVGLQAMITRSPGGPTCVA